MGNGSGLMEAQDTPTLTGIRENLTEDPEKTVLT